MPDVAAPSRVGTLLREWRQRRRLSQLHEELASYPGGPPAAPHDPAAGEIAVPLRVRLGGRVLAFISTLTTFGTAVDVTVSELSIESFFPA